MSYKRNSNERRYSMTREEAINFIEGLFPADAQYEGTREIGIALLEEAKRNVSNWRTLPDEVLFEYARLCEAEEADQERRSRRVKF